VYRGTSLIIKSLNNHGRTLGIVLLQGPGRGVFLMSEVPLQAFDVAVCVGAVGVKVSAHHSSFAGNTQEAEGVWAASPPTLT
jgi:hypothetical protein